MKGLYLIMTGSVVCNNAEIAQDQINCNDRNSLSEPLDKNSENSVHSGRLDHDSELSEAEVQVPVGVTVNTSQDNVNCRR